MLRKRALTEKESDNVRMSHLRRDLLLADISFACLVPPNRSRAAHYGAMAVVSFCIVITVFAGTGHALVVTRADRAPTIDGALGDPVWKQAYAGDFVGYKGNKIGNATKLYLACDKENLYVAFHCFEKQMDKLCARWSRTVERDSPLWKDDCVEIFLDPLNGGNRFYHIIVNPVGVVYDAFAEKPSWDCGIRVATRVGADSWIAEMAIPFRDLGYVPIGGEVWRGNFCREEKPAKELSCLSPTYGGFENPERFIPLQFPSEHKPVSVRVRSLAWQGQNAVQLAVKSRTKANQNLSVAIGAAPGGGKPFRERVQNVSLAGGTDQEVTMTYGFVADPRRIRLVITNTTAGRTVYSNTFSLPSASPGSAEAAIDPRVWRKVSKPLYEELLSEEPPGLARQGAMIWATFIEHFSLRPFAQQFGFHYVYEETFKLFADNHLFPIFNNHVSTVAHYNVEGNCRKYGAKHILMADFRTAPAPKVNGWPFLPDPVCTKTFLEGVRTVLRKQGDLIWGVFSGDEMSSAMETVGITLFETQREKYPYILRVDAEVKKEYGGGKYGMPKSLSDLNPYRRIAYRRWLNDRLADVLRQLRETVKSERSDMPVISFNPVAYHHPYDFSLWGKHCDIVTHQLYPKPHRAVFGFLTKLVKDISGTKEFWPCAHVENYAASFTPAETLELLGQAFQNGASGLQYYLRDIRGRRSWSKYYMHNDYFGAPERWAVEMAVARHARRMNRLRFPKADFAILYSCDSYASRIGEPFKQNEVEWAYTLLGPMVGSWFTFIDDNQIARDEKDLSVYKTIYVPFAKYQRKEVVERLMAYAEQGGTLIAADPEAFSLSPVGENTSAYGKKLFGVTVVGPQSCNTFKYNGKDIPVVGRAFTVQLADTARVMAAFDNGSPAIISHAFGKGRAIAFAFSPFEQRAVDDPKWHAFFKSFQQELGLKVDHSIWRFRLPASLITPLSSPKQRCITNNHVLWRRFKPVDVCSTDTGGTYRYSRPPDGNGDNEQDGEVPFARGKLTDRKRAIEGGNVDMKKSRLEDWVVTYKRTDPFDITFDFKKSLPLTGMRLFYSGQLPAVSLAASNDGAQWTTLTASAGPRPSTPDCCGLKLDGPFGTNRFLRIRFGARSKAGATALTLAEVEVWAE